MGDTEIKITKQKKLQLEKELYELEEVQSKQLASDLEDARNESLSDETTVVTRLLEEKEALDSRVAEIKHILSISKVLRERKHKKVELGCEVVLQVGRKKLTFRLVDAIESDPLKHYISDDSPLGKELINAKLGDTISLKLRDGVVEYKVLEVC